MVRVCTWPFRVLFMSLHDPAAAIPAVVFFSSCVNQIPSWAITLGLFQSLGELGGRCWCCACPSSLRCQELQPGAGCIAGARSATAASSSDSLSK